MKKSIFDKKMQDPKFKAVYDKVSKVNKNSYKFFENKDCKYYPCHKGLKELNCLFCYCPLFHERKISALCQIMEKCENCSFPHRAKNYQKIMKMLR